MPAAKVTLAPECASCTLGLVQLAYGRAFWFRVFREPLVFGMRVLARWHRIEVRSIAVHHSRCQGCLRFLKNELKLKSPLFRALNGRVNPLFNRLRDAVLTADEKAEAKRFAAQHVPKDFS